MMKSAYISDIGNRDMNEDSLYIPEVGRRPLYVIADGMGGHNAGSVASSVAVLAVAEYVEQEVNDEIAANAEANVDFESFNVSGESNNEVETMLKVAMAYANTEVYTLSKSYRKYSGMGTTLTLVYTLPHAYVVAHIGDSRLYHYDGYSLSQITKDHSYVTELLKSGKITKAEAGRHPDKNVVSRALGVKPQERVDIFTFEWNEGDILLLCTDGIYKGVSDEEIKSIFKSIRNMDAACYELLNVARRRGSNDNATVILIKNEEEHR